MPDDGSEIKQMQLLCYDGTHKGTKWLAVKSKGAVQVFRMFRLDRRLSKDWLSREGGSLLYEDYGGKLHEGGVTSLMVTSGGGYGVLVGNWLPLGYNPSGTPGYLPKRVAEE